jgi:hypothetical protein
MKPLLFLDFDGVLCHGMPYGWPDVFSDPRPVDLWERLWHPPAVAVLRNVLTEFELAIVVTTSWLSLGDKTAFEEIFRSTGLAEVAEWFDARQWQAPALRGETRNDAIERWLRRQRQWLAPKVVLDDELSGTGLRGSRLDKAGSVVWCERGVGLHAGHMPQIRRALEPQNQVAGQAGKEGM